MYWNRRSWFRSVSIICLLLGGLFIIINSVSLSNIRISSNCVSNIAQDGADNNLFNITLHGINYTYSSGNFIRELHSDSAFEFLFENATFNASITRFVHMFCTHGIIGLEPKNKSPTIPQDRHIMYFSLFNKTDYDLLLLYIIVPKDAGERHIANMRLITADELNTSHLLLLDAVLEEAAHHSIQLIGGNYTGVDNTTTIIAAPGSPILFGGLSVLNWLNITDWVLPYHWCDFSEDEGQGLIFDYKSPIYNDSLLEKPHWIVFATGSNGTYVAIVNGTEHAFRYTNGPTYTFIFTLNGTLLAIIHSVITAMETFTNDGTQSVLEILSVSVAIITIVTFVSLAFFAQRKKLVVIRR